MLKVDAAGAWLEATSKEIKVLKVPSVRSCKLDVSRPVGIVWHWTGGKGGTKIFAPALAEEIRTYKPSIDRAASWHLLIAKDGRVFQSVPFDKGSWHVGRPGRVGKRMFGNINKGSVGIELENAGELKKIGENYYCWPYYKQVNQVESGPNPAFCIPSNRVAQHETGYYDAFPLEQETTAEHVIRALTVAFRYDRVCVSHGHIEFDPSRKIDPGPLWQKVVLPRILDCVFGPGGL